MSEWLTTGEMIDALKVGEVAECINANSEVFSISTQVTKIEGGSVVWNCGHLNHRAYLAGDVVNAKWRILPKYVTFIAALKAASEGKKVKFHDHGSVYEMDDFSMGAMRVEKTPVRVFSLRTLYNGNWSIEEDPND